MRPNKKTLRICKKRHQFYKVSNCKTCPVCEKEQKPNEGFLALLSAPARRALQNHNIHTLQELAKYTVKDILKLHGLGKASIPILIKALTDIGLSFKAA